ncbi:hypothetical protein BN126340064 [Stenotrophomonas thermophila]|nr:hypothetical protein BN126340064 [Stenotrophomonas maltophilia]
MVHIRRKRHLFFAGRLTLNQAAIAVHLHVHEGRVYVRLQERIADLIDNAALLAHKREVEGDCHYSGSLFWASANTAARRAAPQRRSNSTPAASSCWIRSALSSAPT